VAGIYHKVTFDYFCTIAGENQKYAISTS